MILIALAVLWGGSFFFSGIAVRELPSFTTAVERVGIAAVVLWAVLALQRICMPRIPGLSTAFSAWDCSKSTVPFALLLATAVAPMVGTWLLAWFGPNRTLIALFGGALLNFALVVPLAPMAFRRH